MSGRDLRNYQNCLTQKAEQTNCQFRDALENGPRVGTFISNNFFFQFQNLEFEFIREDLGYGTIDLLCDIGGTLSLLMGASLLTCCELLEVAWIMLVKKCCNQLSTTTSNHNEGPKRPRKRLTSKKLSTSHEGQTEELCAKIIINNASRRLV
jgi:hypothetical protein